jgi:L-ribulose-5-phosphate 4-epimerase
MAFDELRAAVWAANLELNNRGLVTYTWGNVSGIDRDAGIVAIKPSGVGYDTLTPGQIVLIHLADGTAADNSGLRPSSDTPTHLVLYRAFPQIGGVAHSHSVHATMFAQACRAIPCYGTTHADHFYGTVPVTAALAPDAIKDAYEAHTGDVIVDAIGEADPLSMPAALVAHHAPFTWGADAAAAVRHSVILEEVARMALGTLQLRPDAPAVDDVLLDKHYLRKHGTDAYYGQPAG